MHAYALELLADKLVPGARVLDVGSGSGYLVAAFAHMVHPGGQVFGIDHIPELVEWSLGNLRKNHGAFLDDGTAHVQTVDGFNGLPEHGPYDVIHVGAAAAEVPQPLIDQLAPGGRIIIPVGRWSQELVQVDKGADGRVHKKPLMGVMYVPLTTKEHQEARAMY
jgi:protein-L-isoaspartate(D-aspartate) O-methyltransferase